MVYTVKEAAQMLKLNPETVKRMIYRGYIQAFKAGRAWRIKQEEIERIKGK